MEHGSRLTSPNAAEASHLYFAEGVWSGFADSGRHTRRWRNAFASSTPRGTASIPPHAAAAEIAAELTAGVVTSSWVNRPDRSGEVPLHEVPLHVIHRAAEHIGNPTWAHATYAASLVSGIPLTAVGGTPALCTARAIILGLLIHADQPIRERQLRDLSEIVESDVFSLLQQLIPLIDDVDVRAKLPLVDMALPALAAMSPAKYTAFRKGFDSLARADGQLDLFGWTLGRF